MRKFIVYSSFLIAAAVARTATAGGAATPTAYANDFDGYSLTPLTNSIISAIYDHGTWENNYDVGESSCGEFMPATGSNDAECLGVDGWRRRAGGALFSLLDPNKNGGYGWTNGAVLRITKKSTLGVLSVPLGTTVTNGKVRLYFDIFPGRKSVMGNYTEAFAMCFLSGGGMGTATYTGSTSRDTLWKGKAVCGAGYYMNGSANNEYNPGNVCYGAGTLKAIFSPSTAASMCYWHRFVVTADLDAKTYEFAAYNYGRKGESMDYDISALEPIASKSSLAFMTDAPASIDSLFIASQGHGDYNAYGPQTIDGVDYNFGKFPCFDNLRVCLVNADGSDGLELFSCDFTRSTRRTPCEAAALSAGVGTAGADGWVARGAANGTIVAVRNDGANNGNGGASAKVAALAGMNYGTGVVVRELDDVVNGFSTADFAADIRPPSRFSRQSAFAGVEFGGSGYFAGASGWRDAPRIFFGFAENSGEKSYGAYTNVTFAAGTQAGMSCAPSFLTAADTSHWYRFRAKADQGSGTVSVKVYDQGAAAPAADAADGFLVATIAGIALPAFPRGEISAVGLAANGVPGTYGGGADDPTAALIDNLRVTYAKASTFYILK